MIFLLITTVIWGFSFGLIKNNLAGIDPIFVSLCRMTLSLIIFLPFLKLKKVNNSFRFKMLLIGAVQYGVMYICYISAFQFLKAYEVAHFTIFTPLFVTLFDGIFKKRLSWLFLATTVVTIAGTAIVEYRELSTASFWLGFILVQISNLAFAVGQILYRRAFQTTSGVKDLDVFGLLYLGGVLSTGIAAVIFTPWTKLQLGTSQIWSLVYLGIIASGMGFFLWNLGARKVNVGALAIANDLKVPVAILISLVLFGEATDLSRLILGGVIVIAALIINEVLSKRISERLQLKQDRLIE
jgi:drug/metabolite transporter (DMT)-like permease